MLDRTVWDITVQYSTLPDAPLESTYTYSFEPNSWQEDSLIEFINVLAKRGATFSIKKGHFE